MKYNCLSCHSENHRVLNGRNCVCMGGYYDDGVGLECLICNQVCLTCSKGTKNDC